jgi:hypothetical protein
MLGAPTLIALHSVGMAVVVGLTLMVTLHLNRVLTGIDRRLMPRLLNIAVWGFVLNFVTGLALFITRAPEYIVSYMFLIKMLLVLVSAAILFWLRQHLERVERQKQESGADRISRNMSLACTVTWFGAVIAGRLIAYLSDLYR